MNKDIPTLQDVQRLEDIAFELRELLDEAVGILPYDMEQRARRYWYAHARMAIDDDHAYLGTHGNTLADAIDAVRELRRTNDEG